MGEDRVVRLSLASLVEAVGEQVENVVKQVGKDRGLPLHLLESEYEARVGQKLPMIRLNTRDVREMVDLLHAKILARTTFVLESLPEAKNPGQDAIFWGFRF